MPNVDIVWVIIRHEENKAELLSVFRHFGQRCIQVSTGRYRVVSSRTFVSISFTSFMPAVLDVSAVPRPSVTIPQLAFAWPSAISILRRLYSETESHLQLKHSRRVDVCKRRNRIRGRAYSHELTKRGIDSCRVTISRLAAAKEVTVI